MVWQRGYEIQVHVEGIASFPGPSQLLSLAVRLSGLGTRLWRTHNDLSIAIVIGQLTLHLQMKISQQPSQAKLLLSEGIHAFTYPHSPLNNGKQ